jgi:UDP-N-acetylglucosamine--N-acetylmuramyl-(pentapeptide) pyrophosphoryl-undecaprenol N-acetylglucosamine transferase
MKKRIFITGGVSAGHVTPNIALIEHLIRKNCAVSYIGSADGIERKLTEGLDIPYYEISTGKFRRQFNWKNFLDPLLFVLGLIQSVILCHSHKPDIVFSKGGFVAVPVVIGAWICKIPVIWHESDIKPGFVSQLCIRFSRFVCINFPLTKRSLPRRMRGERTKLTGTPVRQSLLKGNASKGRTLLGFSREKPVLLVLGTGRGSKLVNDHVRQCRFQLLRYYQIIHVVGEGNLDAGYDNNDGYVQREYLHQEYGDILAAADLVISRAGANSIYEYLVMRKCHLLIPLSKKVSRGNQIENAETFEKAGMSMVLQEVDLTAESLIESINQLRRERKIRLSALKRFKIRDSVKLISHVIAITIREFAEKNSSPPA